MAMNDLLDLTKTPYNSLVKEWKEKGGKVIGYHCSYVPEEIIEAAGALPYRIRPVGCTDVPLANVYMRPTHCTYARGCLEYLLGGQFDFLDGLVVTSSCDHMRRIYDILEADKKKPPFLFFLNAPYNIREDTINRYKEEITKLKKALEDFLKTSIDDKKLNETIIVNNKTREQLKQLYELRRQPNPPVSGTEAMAISVAATVTPKTEFNKLLTEALSEFAIRKGISDYRARLMLMGGYLDDPEYVSVIEGQGGLVCADTLCTGSRHFMKSVPTGKDALSALAEGYMRGPACPRIVAQYPEKNKYMEEIIRDYNIDGVIHERIRYCDTHAGDLLLVRKRLNEMNVPLLELEREYWLSSTGQFKTRVQAFIETIEVRR